MLFLLACLVLAFCGINADYQEEKDSFIVVEMGKLDFLVGHWRTLSTIVQTGVQAPGDLSYLKVLGGNYIFCRFDGEHPTRSFWQAYVMITYDPAAGHYVSYAFYRPGPPATYSGAWRDENTVTFTIDAAGPGGSRSRISYTRKPDGTVFQLNEASDAGGNWHPTLETVYQPWGKAESK